MSPHPHHQSSEKLGHLHFHWKTLRWQSISVWGLFLCVLFIELKMSTCFHVWTFMGSEWSSFWVNHKSSLSSLLKNPLLSDGWPILPPYLLPFQKLLQLIIGSQRTRKNITHKIVDFIASILTQNWTFFLFSTLWKCVAGHKNSLLWTCDLFFYKRSTIDGFSVITMF